MPFSATLTQDRVAEHDQPGKTPLEIFRTIKFVKKEADLMTISDERRF